MGKVGIIGVGQSAFVRGYPGSIRELAFEGFREAMQDAQFQIRTSMHRSFVRPRNTTSSDRLPGF